MAPTHMVMMTTVASEADARKLATVLVENKAAACVQVMPIRSCYIWDGKVNDEAEHLLLIKTRADLYDAAAELIRRNHTYEVPEIIGVPIMAGAPSYLGWIDTVTKP